ncbi:hypothetical protein CHINAEXTREME_18785 [Halobiforma lacisalsi AJ5]|uniref:Uncharacterized protein n=1 Tax=Natronobacterium lacisalsi AJ5 TaxID=358396 RepID=M0LUU0_NATLA|nr:hypothetical protein [Halobiforma lacisalsi]APW99691.1 hypothetical protein CHINAEXTREME_18785 [Halobiforma lacisalsi AJ5]EMA36139.1 hypothetical protein C445_04758 [Halobiforma lacisalsi AJ5]
MIGDGFDTDTEHERGISVAVTHVLTIGITTILIAMLLTSGATLLESETERSAESSLETIGERLADEIENVDRMANEETHSVIVTTEHPGTVANSRYTVELLEGDNGNGECSEAPLLDGSTDCLRLTSNDIDRDVYVPLVVESAMGSDDPVAGGTIEIVYDGDDDELRLEGGNR